MHAVDVVEEPHATLGRLAIARQHRTGEEAWLIPNDAIGRECPRICGGVQQETYLGVPC
jgi:hypothetical protein